MKTEPLAKSPLAVLEAHRRRHQCLALHSARFVRRLLWVSLGWFIWAGSALSALPMSLSHLTLLGLWMLPMPLFILQAWYHGLSDGTVPNLIERP